VDLDSYKETGVKICLKCNTAKEDSNYDTPSGQVSMWCGECRFRAVRRGRKTGKRKANKPKGELPFNDRIVDWNAIPTQRPLTYFGR